MANTIQIKRSSTANTKPTTAQLSVGELAVNTVDKRLFARDAAGTPVVWEVGVPTGGLCQYAGNEASTIPPGWLLCNGQSVSTTTYAALFAVVGYTFGGSGASFLVPDMRGRTAIGAGQGTGLSNRTRGGNVGAESVALSSAEMPAHTHGTHHENSALGSSGTTGTVKHAYAKAHGVNQYSDSAGGGAAHNNMQPSLVMNFLIKT